jgi:hypothetical protein
MQVRFSPRSGAAIIAVIFGFLASAAMADKIHIEHAADLPRFNYPYDGPVEKLATDQATYDAFAVKRRADIQSVLDQYQIDDKSTLRDLISEASLIDFLTGHYDQAEQESLQVRDLQEKPSAKILSGNELRAFIAAAKATGSTDSQAFRSDAVARVKASLQPMPFATVEENIKEIDSGKMIIGEGLVLGRMHDSLQPIVDQKHSLSSDLVGGISGARFQVSVAIPIAKQLAGVYDEYLAANQIVKPDIWMARDVSLPADAGYKPVAIGIWDSGVDAPVYPNQILMENGKPTLIAFDLYSKPDHHALFPLTPAVQADLPEQEDLSKGFSDLRSHIQSPEAQKVEQMFSTMKPEQTKAAIEALRMVGNYSHGTHVSGIAIAGNPFARIAEARISFDYKTIPDPCPSFELAERGVKANQEYVEYFKRHHVRVVNMSWGGDVHGYETSLEQCGMGKDADDRKAIARKMFDIEKNGLTKAIASAPGILFVAAAGNSDQDAAFIEDIPAGIKLPNLIAVGAVDQAGDEASFTSYGPTVVVDANGYQVKSKVPGGKILAESGTSMAAPQVTNLAGKLFTVDPKLTPTEVIELIRSTATTSQDQRRHLIDPKAALEKAKADAASHTAMR